MKHSKLIITLAVVAISLIWLASAMLIFKLYGEPESPGIVGDSFGAINALFSGLALAGVLYAIWLQREELEIQREETTTSRRELAEQNRLITEQLKQLKVSYDFERNRAALEASPHLRKEPYTILGGTLLTLNFTNIGGPIYKVSCVTSPKSFVEVSPSEGIHAKDKFSVQAKFGGDSLPSSVDIQIQCRDKLDSIHNFQYLLKKDENRTRLEQVP